MRARYVLTILLCGFFLSGCDSKNEAKTKAEANTSSEKQNTSVKTNTIAGKEVYDRECKSCHGSDGKMKALGKSNQIAGIPAKEILKEIQEYKNGTLDKHGMGNIMKLNASKLQKNDTEAVAAYIASLKK